MAYSAIKITRSSEESVTIGEGLDRSYSSRYDVVLDVSGNSAEISALQVYTSIVGLPQYGQPWVSPDGTVTDYMATMRGFTGRRDHSSKSTFVFNVTHSTRGPARAVDPRQPANRFQNTGGVDDLSKLMPVWSLEFEDRFIPYSVDLDDADVVNSAYDLIDPLPTKNDPLIVIPYSSYLAPGEWDENDIYGSLAYWYGYKFATNQDDFLFASGGDSDIGRWIVWDLKIMPELVGMNRVYRRDMVLKYSSDGWRDNIPSMGRFELINPLGGNDPSNKRPILAPKSTQPTTIPVMLTATGQATYDAAQMQILSFRSKEPKLFSELSVELI